MAAANYNLHIEKGATFRQKFVWKQKTGLPVDLTGYSAKMQIRPTERATRVILELTDVNTRIIITPLEGTIELYLQDEDTALIADTEGVYDLLLTASNGDVIRLARGKVILSDGVTRNG